MSFQSKRDDRETDISLEEGRQNFSRAMLNILDDFGNERTRQGETQRAILNILDDAAGEKIRLEDTQRAILNILSDSSEEKARLTDTQRAVLNILDDFEIEQRKVKQQALELALSNKELDSFAYSVSHDLKAPLRGISQIADWIYHDFKDKASDEQKENLELMKRRVIRMNDLIEGILKYARLGRTEEIREMVDCSKIVREVIDSINAPKRVEIEIVGSLPKIKAVRVHIEQIFQNLLSNAVRYMDKDKGEIKIGCKENDSQWEFYVQDNGPGIAQEHFERIFKIFQTLAPRDRTEATGIGLSIVKKVVELNGGRIWLESQLGKGSTFYFTLPKKYL
ncbi:MAG: histidine kinase [Chlamydiae bacterium]|nr:histidine kinase [Chlamydiota bacterium]MBI3278046.1 histidine kinase [Chlamydiota bacterium]